MKLLLSQNFISHALLATSLQGFGNLFLLFALCFAGVHLAKITARGWRLHDGTTTDKTPESPPETKLENKQPSQDAVYYIVEKKRRRSKPSYGEPKQIHFK